MPAGGEDRQYPEAQGPGPPHRPHIPGAGAEAAAEDLPEAPAAKTLSARAVLVELHCGHFTVACWLIVRCNCSNFPPHDWQVYS
jgi:hypothetical protein